MVGVALGAGVAIAGGSVAGAHSGTPGVPVQWDAGPDAERVGLIGDSTLTGVRWTGRFGELTRFSVLFDAESCRRTVETSCWSREQYRPVNAITALRDRAGQWGEVLVMMTGYNDPDGEFAEGVRAIVEEARRQGIGTVVWLSLRTRGVDYEEPLHRANGDTYRNANRALYELVDELGGSLQVADWAGYSADHPEWFEADGAHLAAPGVDALTGFIARQLDVVLRGGDVTADPPPWEDVRRGDEGPPVVAVQQALAAAGFGQFGEVDGVFGSQTWGAVGEFQRREGLPDHGVVDQATAVRLNLTAAPAAPVAPASRPTTAPTTTPVAAVSVDVPLPVGAVRPAPRAPERGSGVTEALWVVLALSPAVVWMGYRWVDQRRGTLHDVAHRHASPPPRPRA